jgi:hypothetical protein
VEQVLVVDKEELEVLVVLELLMDLLEGEEVQNQN